MPKSSYNNKTNIPPPTPHNKNHHKFMFPSSPYTTAAATATITSRHAFLTMASMTTCLWLVYSFFFVTTTTSSSSSMVAAEVPGHPDVAPSLEDILRQAHQGPLYTYPTSLTQGIVKGIHSHNDYWRPVPFYTALSVGAISTESDVWLYNDTLYVGHETSALTAARTFESLYLGPIMDVLARQNPKNSAFVSGPTQNGVFDTDGGQTLYLFVDLKTDGAETWPVVLKALEPLREAGYLSYTNGTTFTSRAVTVIGTGNTPLNLVQPITNRDYFWDAPIATLNSSFSNITSLVSPIASADFVSIFGQVVGTSLNDSQVDLLRDQVKVAHAKGIKLRYWDQPLWPLSTRNGIWRQLRSEGVDLINADDVEAAAGFGDTW